MNTEENSISKTIVYPNPNSGTFYIKGNGISTQISIEIYDILGRQVYQNNNYNLASASEISIDNKGVYILQVTDGTTIYKEKILVK